MTSRQVLLTEEDARDFYKSEFYGNKYVTIHKQWFPVKSSPILAGIVSDIMCDGHLQQKLWRIDYCSKNKAELRRFENRVFENFGLKGKIRKCTTNRFGETYLLGINNKLFSRILHSIGTPSGAKVKTRYLIPQWIINDKENFRTFVRRYFSCEGTVSVEGKNSFIEIILGKIENIVNNGFDFLNQMKFYLSQHFGIKTMNVFVNGKHLRKDGLKTYMLKMRIKKTEDLYKFYKEIGFEDKRKQIKLEKVLRIKGQPGMGQ